MFLSLSGDLFGRYKRVDFSPFCDSILMLKYVESIEIEHLFVYKPRFSGSKRLAFLGII